MFLKGTACNIGIATTEFYCLQQQVSFTFIQVLNCFLSVSRERMLL
jgi:hypothetical protein